MSTNQPSPVLYIPHGGGPLPLLADPGHRKLTGFLQAAARLFETPNAILVISAHWEEPAFTVQSAAQPDLLYDYFGFPAESYDLEYSAPGAPALARRIVGLLNDARIDAAVDSTRGFDHGVFVPLTLMYPEAQIPCLQLSLRRDLDPAAHIALGNALSSLREENVLILGSGSSFHNMQAFKDGATSLVACKAFDDWLFETCTHDDLAETANALIHWDQAPDGRYAHPREEHLLPLHVCFGAAQAAGRPAKRVFDGDMMGYRMSAFLWR